MTLQTANAGDTIYPATINQFLDILERQAGEQEIRHYFIAGNNYTSSGLFQSCNLIFRSRNVTPISITLDTSDQAMTNLGSPSAGHITMGGAQLYAAGTAVTNNAYGGGKATIQY